VESTGDLRNNLWRYNAFSPALILCHRPKLPFSQHELHNFIPFLLHSYLLFYIEFVRFCIISISVITWFSFILTFTDDFVHTICDAKQVVDRKLHLVAVVLNFFSRYWPRSIGWHETCINLEVKKPRFYTRRRWARIEDQPLK